MIFPDLYSPVEGHPKNTQLAFKLSSVNFSDLDIEKIKEIYTKYKAVVRVNPILGHTSEETALLMHDYPYGYRQRCVRRAWVELCKTNQRDGETRVGIQTTEKDFNLPYSKLLNAADGNASASNYFIQEYDKNGGQIWNATKYSTYAMQHFMYWARSEEKNKKGEYISKLEFTALHWICVSDLILIRKRFGFDSHGRFFCPATTEAATNDAVAISERLENIDMVLRSVKKANQYSNTNVLDFFRYIEHCEEKGAEGLEKMQMLS